MVLIYQQFRSKAHFKHTQKAQSKGTNFTSGGNMLHNVRAMREDHLLVDVFLLLRMSVYFLLLLQTE